MVTKPSMYKQIRENKPTGEGACTMHQFVNITCHSNTFISNDTCSYPFHWNDIHFIQLKDYIPMYNKIQNKQKQHFLHHDVLCRDDLESSKLG